MAGSIAELSKYRYERALEELKNAKEVFIDIHPYSRWI